MKDSEECADRNREVIVRDIFKKVKSKEFNISLSARERGDIALRAAQLLNEMIWDGLWVQCVVFVGHLGGGD